MKSIVIAFTALLFTQPAVADDTVTLLCTFEHGTLEITINYTRETANDTPAMISEKEIVWSPDKDKNFFAIVNRYTGVMQMSNRQKEFTGICRKTTGSGK